MKRERCKVCGYPADDNPGDRGGLCFGVHANCGGLEVKSFELFRVRNKRTGKTWYCADSGMLIVQHPKKWMEQQ